MASADTSGVDELWPSGTVTSVSGWTTGGTGLNLDGGLSDPANTARPYPRLALWELEGAVRTTHNQLSDLDANGNPRVIQNDLPTSESSHATAVASVMSGSGASDFDGSFDSGNYSRGVAYGAQTSAWDADDFGAEFSIDASTDPPLRAANNSYASYAGWIFDNTASKWRWFGAGAAAEDFKFGAYTGSGSNGYSAREIDDRAATAQNTLLVWSSGNDRNEGPNSAPSPNYLLSSSSTTSTVVRDWNDGDDGGYDSIPPQGCAKNALTVGAFSDLITGWDAGTGTLTYSGVASLPAYTTFGPTDDGRIKPDIVACGSRINGGTRNPLNTTNVFFGVSDPNISADDLYSGAQGTSFAAPIATGTVALILQRRHKVCADWEYNGFPARSSTMKALMIATATDITPIGPDFATGYGLLNSAAAVKLMSDDCAFDIVPQFGGITQQAKPYVKEIFVPLGGEISFPVTALSTSTPIKITMVWTDLPGTAHAGTAIDPTTKRLKNDLDLRVYVPGTTTFDPAGTDCYKPWVLNPDLPGKSAAARSTAAVAGSLTSTNDDTANNVEQVLVPSPSTSGSYTIKVTHKNSPAFSADGQWVSVIISGISSPTQIPFSLTGLVQGTPGNVSATLSTVPGGMYNIQGSPDLHNWTNQVININARSNSTTVALTSPPGATSYYWRAGRTY